MPRARIDTPFGALHIACTDDGLVACGTRLTEGTAAVDGSRSAERHLAAVRRALEEYLAGARRTFDDLVLAPKGTAFQLRVWAELRRIPFGTTTTYGDIARRIGRPGAARAVGLANGRNPIGIVVPCHRVIGSDGDLTGYGGGLPMKAWLLRHEGALG